MIIQFLYALIVIALVVLVLYLFERFVEPIDRKIRGLIIFIVAILLIIYVVTGNNIWGG